MGTILNAIIISLVLHYAIPFLPVFEENFLKLIQAILGVFITGIGGGIYLIANLGPGARDGLMTGLQRVTNFPIAWVRSTIELTVLTIGWWLGGVIGLGTIIFALGIGPCLAISLKIFGSGKSQIRFMTVRFILVFYSSLQVTNLHTCNFFVIILCHAELA